MMGADHGELFEHGIQTERSDTRAHVCPENQTVYVFRTQYGRDAIRDHNPRIVPASQKDVVGTTATGWLVKLEWVKDLRSIRFRSWPRWGEFDRNLETGALGALAEACVLDMMRAGLFPFWVQARQETGKDSQISGTDILAFSRARVQVKCDYPIKVTGNLFLQKSERNPLGRR